MRLREALADENPEIRAEAAVALCRLPGARPVTPLAQMLLEGSTEAQRWDMAGALVGFMELDAAGALAPLRTVASKHRLAPEVSCLTAPGLALLGDATPATVALLMERARDGHLDDEVRILYDLALGEVGTPKASAFLGSSLGDESSVYRKSHLLTALALTHDPGAVAALIEGVRSSERDIRWSAVSALGGLLDGTGRLSGARAEDRAGGSGALDEARALAREALVALVDGPGDDETRGLALVSLGRIAGKEDVRYLRGRLETTHGQLRVAAAIGLALAGDRGAERLLEGFLEDSSEPDLSRAGAALALGILGKAGASTRKRLRHYLAPDAPPRMRPYACLAAGLLGDSGALAALQRTVAGKKEDLSLRLDAATAVSLLGSARALGVLRAVIDREERPEVRGAFLRTLGSFPDAAPIPYLEGWIGHKGEGGGIVAISAIHAIGHILDPHPRPLQASFLCDRLYYLKGDPFSLMEFLL